MALAISADDVRGAARRLAGVAHRTPVVTSRTADEVAGAVLFFKCENLQRAGAFKFRGAYNALAQLSPERRQKGVLAYSSGNHAQAIALAARLLGIPAAVVMPRDAPRLKVAATRGYGAEVILYDRATEDREALGGAIAAERGMTLIPPYDHPHVMAGQGTVALELLEEVPDLDAIVTSVGGGGLLSGCAVAAKHASPRCRLFGVEPEAGNDVQQSLAKGEIVHIDVPRTIADGAQTQHAGRHTFPVLQALVERVETVTDAQLVETMRFVAERMKLVVEPTGCLAAAAVLQQRLPLRGQRVGIVVSGGNVDAQRYAELLSSGGGSPRESGFSSSASSPR